MPRSGSTLQYQIAKELLTKSNCYFQDLGWLGNQNIAQLYTKYDPIYEYVLTKQHNYLSGINKIIDLEKLYILISFRDLRDVIVSLMNKNGTSFENVFSKLKIQNFINDFNNWLSFKHVLKSKYEIFCNDINNETVRISQFLNIQLPFEDIEEISKNLSITNQRTKINSFSLEKLENYEKEKYDPITLLHQNHIHSGEVNQWRNILNNFQIGIIQYYAKDWLNKYDYPIKSSIYNIGFFWKSRKALFHILNGTLFYRLFKDSYAKTVDNLFKLSKYDRDFIDVKSSEGFKIRLYKDSKFSSFSLLNEFETSEKEFVKLFLSKGDIFIDAGANIGIFTLIASKIVGNKGKIFSIEPTKTTFERLMEHIELNQFENIIPLNIALSNKKGIAILKKDLSGYDAWNSLARPTKGNIIVDEKVFTSTLDEIVNEHNLDNIKLIKIDVEGWEIPVLLGGKKLLTSEISPVLLVEFTSKNAVNAGYSCVELFNTGIKYGYKWFEFNHLDMKLSILSNANEFEYKNLIALKEIHFKKYPRIRDLI